MNSMNALKIEFIVCFLNIIKDKAHFICRIGNDLAHHEIGVAV